MGFAAPLRRWAPKPRKAGGRAAAPTPNDHIHPVVQKLILFDRGKAISGAPIIIGTNQFPNPPIEIGIAIEKSIDEPWAVIITLYS